MRSAVLIGINYLNRDVKECELHPLFSPAYYLERYPDVAKSGLNPLVHYLRFGAAEGRDPHPLFSTSYYLERYPDVAKKGFNPLLHYIRFGTKERRDPHPLFSTSYYFERYPGVADKGLDPVLHYLESGAAQGYDPHPLFSTAYYSERYPDVADQGFNPLIHYIRFGALRHYDPHPLFSADYYLQNPSDTGRKETNPLAHYVRFGGFEGRDPHPLFSNKYYLELYSDVRKKGIEPLEHYLRYGQGEYRQPHPLIDPEFYYITQPDVLRANSGALLHYLWHGSGEGRAPSPDFDPNYYRLVHPDTVKAGLEPLTHYARWGKSESRSIRGPRFESGIADNYLPATSGYKHPAKQSHCVDVIVPVYRGLEETRACLESVFASDNAIAMNVIVIDDNTPDTDLKDYIRKLAEAGKVCLVEHSANRGFVVSVNEGMCVHPERDVVLLNSDTQVFGDWLDRLTEHAYTGRIGSVTPFSNNATICSYPKLGENNEIPEDTTPEELDQLMRRVNAGRHCAIPTAVGFCMYIRRACLAEVGPFDETTFGLGYGEENDFCMRSLKQGWTHLLAADVFVHHVGRVSFGPASDSQQAAMDSLLRKHPHYLHYIAWHCQTDPANAFRIAATADRLNRSALPVWMSVVHELGGGVVEHVSRIEELSRGDVLWIHLAPAGRDHIRLFCERKGFEFSVTLHVPHEFELLLRLLRQIGVDRIHVHHVLGLPLEPTELAATLGVPYDVTLHDYYFVCPRINLIDEGSKYCGDPEHGNCKSCALAVAQNGIGLDLLSWRAKYGSLLSGASRVIAPSADAARRFQRYFPWLPIIAAWHETVSAPVRLVELSDDEPLRVAVLGIMAPHKGLRNLETCSRLARESGAPVEFLLIGELEKQMEDRRRDFASTGRYKAEELPQLLSDYRAHIVWFPSQIPETFSYTLSACFRFGVPVAVPDLGAFAERVAGREWSWVLPWDTNPEEWLNFFIEIRKEHFRKGIAPSIPLTFAPVEQQFYSDGFAKPPSVEAICPRASDKKKIVLALVSSFPNGQIQACGYVRIVQPLTHPAIGSHLDLRLVDYNSAQRCSADALIVQRTSVTDIEHAEKLVDHCRKSGVRLIYEIDDDLFRLPFDHPESCSYASVMMAAKLLARAADVITVSTGPLRNVMRHYNDRVQIIQNWVDERLWAKGIKQSVRNLHTIRALYMGSVSHLSDLALLASPVRRLKQEFDFELDVIGVVTEAGPSPWFRPIQVPGSAAASYPAFAEWLESAGHWDFGLAPLIESHFNRSKSPLKVYEYAFLGLPTVSSDVQVYRNAVREGETGFLSPNTDQDWYETLKLLCESRILRERLRVGIVNTRPNWTLSAHAQQIKETWESVLFDERPIELKASEASVTA